MSRKPAGLCERLRTVRRTGTRLSHPTKHRVKLLGGGQLLPWAIRGGGNLLLCLPLFRLIGQIKVHPASISLFGGAVRHFVWPRERVSTGVAWPSDPTRCEWLLTSWFRAREMLVSLKWAHYLQRVSCFLEELFFSKIRKKKWKRQTGRAVVFTHGQVSQNGISERQGRGGTEKRPPKPAPLTLP